VRRAAPLAQPEDALARFEEPLRASAVLEGWTARTHFSEACAALWLEGALVHLEELVLHDSGIDIRAPTHKLIRAYAILRARRRIVAEALTGPCRRLASGALFGDAAGDDVPEERRGQLGEPSGAMDSDAEDSNGDGFDTDVIGDVSGRSDGLEAEFAAVDAAIAHSRRVIDRESAAPRPRDPLGYDLDWSQDERLQACRAERDHPESAAAPRRRLGGSAKYRTAAASALARQSSRRNRIARG
jgi:hypothetical protein